MGGAHATSSTAMRPHPATSALRPPTPPTMGCPESNRSSPTRSRGGGGGEEETQQRSEGTQQRIAAAAAVPPRLCSSSRGTALATNSGSLAPAHDSSTPQEVAGMFHRQFSSTSHRTVISPPLLLSSEVSTIDCLRIHLYIGIALSTGPPTHGRDEFLTRCSVASADQVLVPHASIDVRRPRIHIVVAQLPAGATCHARARANARPAAPYRIWRRSAAIAGARGSR